MTAQAPYLFLGQERTLYLGPLAPDLHLSLAASRLLVALEGDMVVYCAHERRGVRCRSALLPVGGRFIIETHDNVMADCHLDVMGYDFAALSLRAEKAQPGSWFSHLCDEASLADAFSVIAQSPPSINDMAAAVESALFPSDAPQAENYSVDPRIRATIDRIRANVTGNPPLAELAQAAGLSNSRLVNLFKSQVGVPVRRYRLWHRLFVACGQLAVGASITEAAHASGFTDGAHLSHTFRDILGISARDLFGPQRALRAEVEPMADVVSSMA